MKRFGETTPVRFRWLLICRSVEKEHCQEGEAAKTRLRVVHPPHAELICGVGQHALHDIRRLCRRRSRNGATLRWRQHETAYLRVGASATAHDP